MAEVGSQGGKGRRRRALRKSSFAGAPGNSTIANTIACCFIFSNMRGPEGHRGCGNPIFRSVLLMEPLAVFMPDLLPSVVGHARSPEPTALSLPQGGTESMMPTTGLAVSFSPGSSFSEKADGIIPGFLPLALVNSGC